MDASNESNFNFIKKAKNKIVNFFNFFKNNKIRQQTQLDQKLIYSLSKSKVPNLKQFKYFNFYLNKFEKIVFYASFLVFFASLGFLGFSFYKNNLIVVPAFGGEHSEALIGYPKYINPLYSSVSDADSDITSLIFSSLFKRNSSADLINDLTTDYFISEDAKTYTFNIREDAVWHNGEKLSAKDIVFTFNAIKNEQYKSPLRSRFLGVKIEEAGDYQIKFILEQPYTPFVELLTFGILPHNLWAEISPGTASLSELNLWPIGSGPYKFKSAIKDKKSGRIKEYYLVVNDEYYGKKPYIEKINFLFFVNYEEAINALNQNIVNAISYLPQEYHSQIVSKESYNFHRIILPQITTIFFNQKNNEVLKDKDFRRALAIAINKEEIEKNFDGQISMIDGPFLPDSFGYNPDIKKYDFNQVEARKIFDEKDWKIAEINEEDLKTAQAEIEALAASSSEDQIDSPEIKSLEEKLKIGQGNWRQKDGQYLKIKLSGVDNRENRAVLESVKNYWEKIGVKTELEFYSPESVQSDFIKPRNFEALFYSQILGQDPDPYVFWHSSQANTGLNLSDFENKDLDKLLEEARTSMNYDLRAENYKKFQEIITNEIPAIFMYSQTYTYLQNKKVKGFDVKKIINPYNRFANIFDWYITIKKKLSF